MRTIGIGAHAAVPGPEYRTDLGSFRWLIFGALGAATTACGGRAGVPGETDTTEQGAGNPASQGGRATYQPPSGGIGGTASVGSPHIGTPAPTSIACEGPVELLGGNWERCANGIIHRTAIGVCSSSLPRPGLTPDIPRVDAGAAGGADTNGVCTNDSECTAASHGYCETSYYGESPNTYCNYGCVRDSECDAGYVCLCGDPVGHCVPASCDSDQDCSGNLMCSNYDDAPGCGGLAFACQTPSDECGSELDCGAGNFCALDRAGDSHRACSSAQCSIGRPFYVDGEERLAPWVERADWGDVSVSRGSVGSVIAPELREALVQGWLEQARMEHASVAAFARFALQLTALGAPPALLTDTASAMLDEIRHARGCFELARFHSGRALGPGPLPIAGALEDADLASIVRSTIAEGCIGETVAAVEATEVLAYCEDAGARSLLEAIARDEARHAELAWRFVAWALATGPASLSDVVRQAFAAQLEQSAPAPVAMGELDADLLRHGLMSAALRPGLRQRVLDEVVAPAVQGLLERPAQETSPLRAREYLLSST